MDEIIATLREVQDEQSLSKAVKQKIDDIISILEGPGDTRLKASKALTGIEELSDNSQLPSFTRSQLWNVSSILETR